MARKPAQHHPHHENQGCKQRNHPSSGGGGQEGRHHQGDTQKDYNPQGAGGFLSAHTMRFFSQGPNIADPQADQHGKKRSEMVPVDENSRGNVGTVRFPPQDVRGRAGHIGKSLSGISVFQGDLTEIFFGLQECIYDLWVKVGPLFFRDDLNGFLMREWVFVNPGAGQGIIGIG